MGNSDRYGTINFISVVLGVLALGLAIIWGLLRVLFDVQSSFLPVAIVVLAISFLVLEGWLLIIRLKDAFFHHDH